MTAKEMFEKLGYKISNNDDLMLSYVNRSLTVVFWKPNETYNAYIGSTRSGSIDAELHKAITQQMQELGWIE